jgi:hypothetical protein
MIIIEEIIGEVVKAVKTRLGRDVFYSYGHIREIAETLINHGKTHQYAVQKYPRVMLLCDFRETEPETGDYEAVATVQILIVAGSNPTFRAEDRIEKVFKPVLIPIYEELMGELKHNTPYVSVIGEWERIKRYYLSGALNDAVRTLGVGSQNVKSLFNDHLDGIEIRNLKLKFENHC